MRMGKARPSCKAFAIIVPRSLNLRANGISVLKIVKTEKGERRTGLEALQALARKRNKAESRAQFELPKVSEY